MPGRPCQGKKSGVPFSCLCHRCSVSSIGNQKKGNSEVSIASGTPSVTATSKIYVVAAASFRLDF